MQSMIVHDTVSCAVKSIAQMATIARAVSAAATAAGVVYLSDMPMCGGTSPKPSLRKESSSCKPLVLCGPSGAGKSTLIGLLMKEYPGEFGFSVSHTTRAPRPGEVHGVHYYFVDKDAMEKEISEGKFLETARVHGNIYGTSVQAVQSVAEKDQICILDIDVQGVNTCRSISFDGTYIFIAPPTIEALRHRLETRGTETPDKIEKRVKAAEWELAESKGMEWHDYIVNDDLNTAYEKLKLAVQATRQQCNAARESLK